MENRFTEGAKRALTLALHQAEALGQAHIGSEHLLLGILEEGESAATQILNRHGIFYSAIRESVAAGCKGASEVSLSSSDLTPRVRRMLDSSLRLCERSGRGLIGVEHLLYSLLAEEDCLGVRLIEQGGACVRDIQRELMALIRPPKRESTHSERVGVRGGEVFWRDLVSLAREGGIDPTLCREAETDRVIRILCRRKKNNPCLIGEPGVGKTAIAEGLALRIAEGRVPPSLSGKLIYALDLPSMVAGAKYRGEFEERMKELISECAADPRIILFIDEIHTLIGAGGAEGAIDAANILKPSLARGEIRVIGATTLSEYRRYVERDAALERRFQPVYVNEPSAADARRMLLGLRSRYEEHHGLSISDEAIDAAIGLSVRYIHDRFLPDKAIDLIDEAAARVRLGELSERSGDDLLFLGRSTDGVSVGYEDVAAVVTELTGIPTSRLMGSESERLLGLEAALGEKIIGQDSAIRAVSEAIRRGRLGFGQAERPIGAFLFAGPSGVGKTALCVALAEHLFGTRDALLRFDMSEYMEKHSVSKLIGSPPGYVGYGEGGALTEGVHRNPYCIVLFDEVEKAHPEIFDLMLQILEDGVLTDSQGRHVSFADALIVMTSNLGTGCTEVGSLGFCSGGESVSERERRIRRAIEGAFRVEFLSRIDEVVIFNSLSVSELEKICSLMLESLSERLRARGISAVFTPEVCRAIIDRADSGHLGARGLRRSIRRMIEEPLARLLLAEGVSGDAEICVDLLGGEARFSVSERKKSGEAI